MKKPYKSWPCGCYATGPRHIRVCYVCGTGGQRAIWRLHGRLRSMAKKEKLQDAVLGTLCKCGHHRAVHMAKKGDCLADVDDPEAAGVSTCFCERFVEERVKG